MVIRWLIGVATAAKQQRRRVMLFTLAIFSVLTLSFSVLNANTSSAQPVNTSNYSAGVSTCSIEMVGWVICPTLRTIARMGDYGFAFINKTFLEIDYSLTNTQSGTYKAWEVMRNIANIVFVLVFLIIIYSQVTGKNSGGYSIKRMLPRLILGAVFVNLSYFICAIGAELSNVLGSVIFSITNGVVEQIGGTPGMSLAAAQDGFKDGVLTEIVSSMLTKTGTVWILLAPIAIVTTGIAVVSAVALVLLIARKVVASMLILISPLMFVAYLLPNTENYFKQWVRLSLQLLLIYPVIALLLGAGQIVSATIDSIGDSGYKVEDDNYETKSGSTSTSAMTRLAAAAAAVMPLLGVWFVMKGVTTVATSAGSKLSDASRGIRKSDKSEARMGKLAGKTPPTKSAVAGGNFDKRPTFMRRRRKSALGGSAIGTGNPAGGGLRRPGTGADKSNTGMPTASPTANDPLSAGALGQGLSEAKAEEINNAQLAQAAQAKVEGTDGLNVDADAIQASLSKKDKDDDKKKTDFNNKQKPPSKDQMRSFGAAGGQQSSGGSNGQAPNGGQANEYRAPSMAQAGGINTQNAGQANTNSVQQIVAVPVQVDASALLGKKPGGEATAANAVGQFGVHDQVPVSGSEAKAKARAQKYIFDAANDVEEARKALDLKLTEKKDDDTIDLIHKDSK